MLRILLIVGALGLAWTAHAAETAGYPRGQLPGDIAPNHYTIDLTIIPEQKTFTGKTVIDITLEKPAALIWLHGQDLTVSEAKVIDADGTAIAATWAEIPNSDGVVKLTLAQPAQGPKAQISVTYTAPFNRQLEGLYRSDEGGESYAFSQMEPISARLAFPSFDEPRFKTSYDIALTVRAAHTAVSNTPELKIEPLADGMKRVTFAMSKPLPTYLIAFAVGPLDVVESQPIPRTALRDREIPLRGITAKGKGPQIKYALDNTARLLIALEDYFGIPYPFEKLDLIAATDFSAGAMENAGAIVYREPLMLMDDTASLSQKRRYVEVHTHEMAHQWFGNLVTPMWWNDIWLNEAFATWMSYKIADATDPQGEYSRLTLNGALGAMNADSRTSARRIAQPIESNDDIDNAFDGITYEKGGGVLAMFEQYYGAEAFRKGIKLHMERHAWGNATAKDFLQSIADANRDAKGGPAFETFLNQPGVPLIAAELKCSGKDAAVNVKQSRYLRPLGLPTPPAQTQIWKIPVCIAHGDGAERAQTCTLVEDRAATIKLKTDVCPTWVMPNADGAGYFRFALSKQGWSSILAAADTLTEKEVLAALDSLDAAFDAGDMDIGDYLDRTKVLLSRNGGNMAWDTAAAPAGQLTWIKETLVSEKSRPAVAHFIRDLYGPLYDKVGLDPVTPMDRSNPVQATLLRGPVVNMAVVEGGLAAGRTELARRGAAYLGLNEDGTPGDGKIHPEAVDANLVDHAVDMAVREFGTPVVDAVFAHIKTERAAVIRSRMLRAITRATDPATAAKVRALALSDTLRGNEVPIIVYGSAGEPENRAASWTWFKTNFDAIKQRTPAFGQGGLVGVGGRFCSKAERDDYKKFFEPRIEQLNGAPRTFASTLETIDQCIAMVEKHRAKADTYFAAR
jgi:alanyl aminopeptidase